MKSDRLPETVLFTDIVGSTERAAELGDHRWRDLLRKHDALVRGELERCGGREINTIGDGFIALFYSPAEAIHCACAIRDAVRSLGIEIRSGLHTGEVDVSGKTVGGIAVHIGSRVSRNAGPGEVLVSSTVHDLVSGSGFTFEQRGMHGLKGVPGEWRLYAVTGRPPWRPPSRPFARWREAKANGRVSRRGKRSWLAGTTAAALVLVGVVMLGVDPFENDERTATVAGANAGGDHVAVAGKTIAVLPFSVKGMGSDDWMREGLTDLLSINLDGVAGLRATPSRTVLARWRERVPTAESPDLSEALQVGRLAGARYALVGSATRIGDHVRVVAEVYDLQTGGQTSILEASPGRARAFRLGSRQVEGRAADLVSLVDELSVELVGVLPGPTHADGVYVDLARITTGSPVALKAYLEGEAAYRRGDLEAAVTGYRRAVEADSTFALAFYRLALVYREELWELWDPNLLDSYLDRAIRLSTRLPERDRRRVEAYRSLQRSTPQGLRQLRMMTVHYPDDAEAWFQFGAACHTEGFQALADRLECDRALARAIDIDSTFTPAYTYLIESAFNQRADSTQAANLIGALARLAPTGNVPRWNRLAFALAFGDSMDRARAQTSLDTLSAPAIQHVVRLLAHPSTRSQQEVVLLSRSLRNDPEGAGIALALFFNHFGRGKLRSAMDHLDRAIRVLGQSSAVLRSAALYNAFARGLPVPREDLEQDLILARGDTAVDLRAFFAGAFAADQDRWPDHRAAVERFQRYARQLGADGDSTRERFVQGIAQALDGYGLWKRGRLQESVRLLEIAQTQVTGRNSMPWDIQGSTIDLNSTIRFWLGMLLLETGRPREAQRYFNSFWQDPALPHYYLGKVYEEQEEFEAARRAYELFALGWRDADPELQALVEDARSTAVRLASVIRE